MNQYVTGAVIRELRERKNITQAELAGRLNVSDKTVSKWETVKFYPEWNAEARFPVRGTEKILFFCNRDGLFSLPLPKR